jgi:hypothetical protein
MSALRQSLRTTLRIALVAAPILMSAASAGAEARTREHARIGPNDRQTHSRTHTVHDRAIRDGTYNSTTTRTLPNGKQATRQTEATVDREAGTWDRSTTTTGPNGRERSVDVQGQRTDMGYTREAVRTGADGGETVTNTQLTRTDDGFVKNTTVTGANGKTATSTSTRQRTDDGYLRDASATGPNGRTVTQHAEGSYDPETQTAMRTRTTTAPNGKSVTTTTETTRAQAP